MRLPRSHDLQGKIVSCCQFTESDFLLRDLAREAGLEVNVLPDLTTAPDPAKINVVVTDEGGKAGDVFIHDLKGNFNKLAELCDLVAQDRGSGGRQRWQGAHPDHHIATS